MANVPKAVIVLAAGQGTRMKSKKAKVLHGFAGKSLLGHCLDTAAQVGAQHIVLVVRHQRDEVVAHAQALYPGIIIADQDEIPGTGRAVWCGLQALKEVTSLDGTVVVTSGDVPLLEEATIAALLAEHEQHGAAVSLLTTQIANPFGYGRIQRVAGQVAKIVEERDATYAQKQIKEINAGIYAFDAAFLDQTLPGLSTNNDQGEIYLTDTVQAAREAGRPVASYLLTDTAQAEGCNDRLQLSQLHAIYNERRCRYWMLQGVTIIDPATTWIDAQVQIGIDTTIYPGTQLQGQTVIGQDCQIGPDSTLTDCQISDGAQVVRTQASEAEIGPEANVGPFTYLRPGTKLGPRTKVGGFCETKNITVGEGSKIPHLSYVGDATIGRFSNIGAASVFANYDGVNKHHSTVGDYCRTGSDNMFVAPVHVGDGVYTGAGTVLRQDVPAGALAVNDMRQRIIENWVVENRAGTPAAQAAAAAQACAGAQAATQDAPENLASTPQNPEKPEQTSTDQPS